MNRNRTIVQSIPLLPKSYMGNNVSASRKEDVTMKIIIRNLEISISAEELRALQNEKLENHEKTIVKPPVEEFVSKEDIEKAKTEALKKIGF